jgi:hypothetical protein
METTISEISVQTVPAAEKEKSAASCNVVGSCSAVAAPAATFPSSTCATLDSAHKRRRLLHRSEHPANENENVGAAGAHHGSGTFNSKDLPIERLQNSPSVRGKGKRPRVQVKAFSRFSVSFVREIQDQRATQSNLIAVTMRSTLRPVRMKPVRTLRRHQHVLGHSSEIQF